MKPGLSIIIPAWNEESAISETLLHVLNIAWERHVKQLVPDEGLDGKPLRDGGFRKTYEIIVVDDGSTDRTYEEAWPWADRLVKHARRMGKGAALASGIARARGDIFLFLDADLRSSIAHAPLLLEPIRSAGADLVIARLPRPGQSAGFGLAKGLAREGIYRLSGYRTAAPLSGQRAIRADRLRELGALARGFGVEVAMTIDAARRGLRIAEIDVPFTHRETGRDWHGFLHRGRQFAAVGRALLTRWKERKPAWTSDRSSI